jgi:hypothetical protein
LRSPGNATQSTSIVARSPELRHKPVRQDSLATDLGILTTDSDGNLENEWVVWNKMVNNWAFYMKKKPQWIRVIISTRERRRKNNTKYFY